VVNQHQEKVNAAQNEMNKMQDGANRPQSGSQMGASAVGTRRDVLQIGQSQQDLPETFSLRSFI
jgi:hypothetical protein